MATTCPACWLPWISRSSAPATNVMIPAALTAWIKSETIVTATVD